MATALPGFDAEGFRNDVRLAMTVGLPPLEADQPRFVFPRQYTHTTPADEDDVPFDPAARPTVSAPRSVRVPCAVEYVDAEGKVENFGVIVPSKVKITLLDQDYQRVRGFEFVVIGGERYFYAKTEVPVGLDVVGVWTVHCRAEDDA